MKLKNLLIVFAVSAITAFLAVGAILYVAFGREAVKPGLSTRTLNFISDTSKSELSKFLKDEKAIHGVQVVRINLVKNERRAIFFEADEPELAAAWADYIKIRPATSPPLFSDSAMYNDRIANLFNGSFDCREYSKTLSFNYFPAPAAFTPWICSVPIPSDYSGTGDFVGFIAFFLKDEPVGAERERLAKEAVDLANDLFARDMKLKENQEAK